MSDYEYPPNPPTSFADIFSNLLAAAGKESAYSCSDLLAESAQPESSTLKFCPFRKKTYFMAGNEKHSWSIVSERAEFMEEEFQPCLKESCMLYREGACGRS